MSTNVWINDTHPARWGLRFGTPAPVIGAPLATPGRVNLPGLIGGQLVDPGTTVEPARWTVPAAALSGTRGTRWRALVAATFGWVTWRTSDDLTLERRVRLTELTIGQTAPSGATPHIATLAWEAIDPTWQAVEPTEVALPDGVAVTVSNGTALAPGVWELWGAATNPTLTVAGVATALTVTLGASDYLVIDSEEGTVTGVVGGVAVVDGRAYLGVGADFPVLPPRGGTITLSGCRGRLAYRRAEVL